MNPTDELSRKVKEVFDNINNLSIAELKEFALAIRKHPLGKPIYEAFYAYKAPKS